MLVSEYVLQVIEKRPYKYHDEVINGHLKWPFPPYVESDLEMLA